MKGAQGAKQSPLKLCVDLPHKFYYNNNSYHQSKQKVKNKMYLYMYILQNNEKRQIHSKSRETCKIFNLTANLVFFMTTKVH